MRRDIEIRVRFRGKERALRLLYDEGRWHAALIVPGEPDVLTEECIDPSPPGTKLPKMELQEFNLRIEGPKDNVVGLEMGRFLASPGVSLDKDGWIGVTVGSVMANFHDDIGNSRDKAQAREWAQILDFHAARRTDNSRDRDDRGIEQ